MIQYIALGGKQRPILFGIAALTLAKREGITQGDISQALINADWTVLADIAYYALRAGEMAAAQLPDDFEPMNVAIWIDLAPESATKLVKMMADNFNSLQGIEEDPDFEKKIPEKTTKQKKLPAET